MIDMDQLKQTIRKEIISFRKETNSIACSILDKDGFIIYYEKENQLDDTQFKKIIIKLFTTLENLKLINFYKKTEYISFGSEQTKGNDERLYSDGFKILIKSIGENLIFITIFEFMKDLNDIIPKFNDVIDYLSSFFS